MVDLRRIFANPHSVLIGSKGNNSISKYLLKNLKCYFEYELLKIKRINKKWKLTFSNGEIKLFDGLIITAPYAQTKKLIKKKSWPFNLGWTLRESTFLATRRWRLGRNPPTKST